LLDGRSQRQTGRAQPGQYNFMVTFLLCQRVVLGNIIAIIFMAITITLVSWPGVESLAGIKFKCYGPRVPRRTRVSINAITNFSRAGMQMDSWQPQTATPSPPRIRTANCTGSCTWEESQVPTVASRANVCECFN